MPAESPMPTSTPAAQERESGRTQPAQVFGGDCAAVIPTQQLNAATGLQLSRIEAVRGLPRSFPDAFVLQQVGGLDCGWGTGGFGAVYVTIVPADAVPTRVAEPCGSGASPQFGTDFVCELEQVTNGMRMSGIFTVNGGTLATAQSRADAVVALFVASAAAVAPVPLPLPAEGAWSNPAACAALKPALVDRDLLGGAPKPMIGTAGGDDAYITPVNRALSGRDVESAMVQCAVYSDTPLSAAQTAAGMIQTLEFAILGGGAWAQDIVAERPDAAPLTIPGVDRAFLVTDDEHGEWIAVFDGPNYLSVRTPQGHAHYLDSVRILLDVLDASV